MYHGKSRRIDCWMTGLVVIGLGWFGCSRRRVPRKGSEAEKERVSDFRPPSDILVSAGIWHVCIPKSSSRARVLRAWARAHASSALLCSERAPRVSQSSLNVSYQHPPGFLSPTPRTLELWYRYFFTTNTCTLIIGCHLLQI